jgi:hypothetical protein
MPVPLEVQCPKCESKLKLKSRDFLGKKFRCQSCREVFKVDQPAKQLDELDDFESSSDDDWDVDAQSSPPPVPTRTAKRKRATSRRVKLPWPWIGAATAAIAIVCGLFLIPWGFLGRVVGLSDSAHSVLDDLESLSREYEQVLSSVKKGKPRTDVMPDVKDMMAEVEELYFRAVRLRPIGKDELLKLVKQHPALVGLVKTGLFEFDFNTRGELIKSAKTDTEAQFVPEMSRIGSRGGDVLSVIQHLDAPPEPADAGTKTELAMIDVLYEAIDTITGYSSAGDLNSGAAEISSFAQQLKTLAGQLDEQRSSGTAYDMFRDALDERIEEVADILTTRYGDNQNFFAAIQELQRADSPLGEPSHDRHFESGPIPSPFSLRHMDKAADTPPPAQHGSRPRLKIRKPGSESTAPTEPSAKEMPNPPPSTEPAPAEESPFKEEESPFKPE